MFRWIQSQLLMLICLLVLMLTGLACAKKPPNLTPVGQTAFNADRVVVATDRALTLLEPLADQGTIPKTAMQAIIIGSNYVAKGSNSLVAALRTCTSTPANCADVQSAVSAIRSGLDKGIGLIPAGPAHDRVVLLLQPVLDLLLDIYAPASPSLPATPPLELDDAPPLELAYAR